MKIPQPLNLSTYIFIVILFVSNVSNGQDDEIWEAFYVEFSPWEISTDSNLKCYQNSKKYVNFINLNHPSDSEIKNNEWSSKGVWIRTADIEEPLEVEFTIQNESSPLNSVLLNKSNGSQAYYYGNKYWNLGFEYLTTWNKFKTYSINYSYSKHPNSYSTYNSCSISDDGDQGEWYVIKGEPKRTFKILFEDGEIKLYENNSLQKIILGVEKIKYIEVDAGPGTKLLISDTSCKKKTIYGRALPYLNRASQSFEQKNYMSVANEMTTAINKGLKCYETYLFRAIAYYFQECYMSAIEDLDLAINCSKNNKESAYYYRGLSRLALEDEYGINDLKCGGQEGLVFLRENNLINYIPGQNKEETKKQNKKPSKPRKPALIK